MMVINLFGQEECVANDDNENLLIQLMQETWLNSYLANNSKRNKLKNWLNLNSSTLTNKGSGLRGSISKNLSLAQTCHTSLRPADPIILKRTAFKPFIW